VHPLSHFFSCKDSRERKPEAHQFSRNALALYRYVDHGRYESRELILCRDGWLQIDYSRLQYVGRFGIQTRLPEEKREQLQSLLEVLPATYSKPFGMPAGTTRQSYSYLLRPAAEWQLSCIFADGIYEESPPEPYVKVREALHACSTKIRF
jgi:hypothetical protein